MAVKGNPALWVAISIPIGMVVLVALGILLPRYFVKPPQYNFVYTANASGGYSGVDSYIVDEKGMLQLQPLDLLPAAASVPKSTIVPTPLYLYNVKTHTSQRLTLVEAQKLHLDQAFTAPDGYAVQTGDSGGSFPFGGEDRPDQYLVHGVYSQRLGINKNFGNTYYFFQFLGWVTST